MKIKELRKIRLQHAFQQTEEYKFQCKQGIVWAKIYPKEVVYELRRARENAKRQGYECNLTPSVCNLILQV